MNIFKEKNKEKIVDFIQNKANQGNRLDAYDFLYQSLSRAIDEENDFIIEALLNIKEDKFIWTWKEIFRFFSYDTKIISTSEIKQIKFYLQHPKIRPYILEGGIHEGHPLLFRSCKKGDLECVKFYLENDELKETIPQDKNYLMRLIFTALEKNQSHVASFLFDKDNIVVDINSMAFSKNFMESITTNFDEALKYLIFDRNMIEPTLDNFEQKSKEFWINSYKEAQEEIEINKINDLVKIHLNLFNNKIMPLFEKRHLKNKLEKSLDCKKNSVEKKKL